MTRSNSQAQTGPTPAPSSGAAAPLERQDGQLRPEWFGQSATAGPPDGADPAAAEALATRLAGLPAPLLREVTHYAEYLADRYATAQK